MRTPEKKIPISLEWGNLRHDEDLERLLNPCRPSGAEFARNAEKQIFCFMREWKIWKIYVWDEFRSADETTARWDWCFDYKRPAGKACREQSFAHLVAMDDRQFERLVRSLPKSPNEDIVREWREVWRPLGGDGIYFQSFTELAKEEINGHPIAESVVGLVNRVTKRIRAESPSERIVFGLHAMSVEKRLDVIDKTDPSVEILWEDCGGFPFNVGRKFDPAAHLKLTDRILAQNREIGLVLKGMLTQDWTRFAYQSGPYILGCASQATREEDARIVEELWKPYGEDWETRGKVAYDLVRHIQAARPNRPAALNAALNANGDVRFPFALVAEMFWSADEPYETLTRRVRARRWVR